MTAEFAIALPSLVLLIGVMLAVAGVGRAQLGCIDGARAGARLAARGESAARVAAAVMAASPQAAITLTRSGGEVRVGVRASVRMPMTAAPPIWVACSAVAVDEAAWAAAPASP